MTEEQVKEIREALEAIEEGLWIPQEDCSMCRGKGTVLYDTEAGREYEDCYCLIPENRQFIVNSIEWLRQLLADQEALKAENERMRKALEWYADRNNYKQEVKSFRHGTLVGPAEEIYYDEGERARQALSPQEGQETK